MFPIKLCCVCTVDVIRKTYVTEVKHRYLEIVLGRGKQSGRIISQGDELITWTVFSNGPVIYYYLKNKKLKEKERY